MISIDLDRALAQSGTFDVETHGSRVPVSFQRGGDDARTVLFTFHGAVDRETREIPVFQPFQRSVKASAHQVSISDPSMLRDGNFGMSWYAGHTGFPTQEILRELCTRVVAALGAERVIFLGGSGGGFAALYYSWHMPGSLCLALSPQTAVRRYYKDHIKRYLAGCWPDAADPDATPEGICLDVGPLYEQGFSNTVVYLQSIGDDFHFRNHLVPFLNRVDMSGRRTQLLLDCGYWGVPGHSGSVPQSAYVPWLRAGVIAPDLAAETLLQAKHDIVQVPRPTAATTAPAHGKPPLDPAKLARAELIGKWQLGQH